MPTGKKPSQPLSAENGRGVDVHGRPAVDPTQNVIALIDAASRRQDDLRNASNTLTEFQTRHVQEMLALRAEYTKQLSEAEAKRIDAIRAVDVNAVAVASERQAAAATALANQVSQSADALRTLVAQTAAAMAEQNRQQMTQFTDRLTVVERSQYEGRGRANLADPQMQDLLAEMKSLRETRSEGAGKSSGVDKVWGYLLLAAGVVIGVVALFVKGK